MTPIHRRVGILGGGISGVALAAHLDEDDLDVLEKRDRIGGLCGTIIDKGFTFDAAGPHIMFSRNKDVLARMVAALGDNVHQRRRENRIWFKERLVRYPFENDLGALPKEDTFDCILGYLQNPRASESPQNLAQWSYVTFGKGISEKYFIPYNRKIWNYDPEQIGLEFVSRIPKPPMEDVLKSAIGIPTEGYLHQLFFYYPIEGGYESLVHAFASRVKGHIETGWEVASVTRANDHWYVMSAAGQERMYHDLISTLPIHELLKVWTDAPEEARRAAGKLRYNSLINVLIGCDVDPGLPYTAIYVPDPEIVFHRLSFPKAFSERCVPPGSSSIMAEITANEGDGVWELSDEAVMARTVGDLVKTGFVDPNTITYKRVVRFLYGYPVYDLEYRRNVTAMRDSVRAAGIHLLGRFAEFDYINSDVCIERALALSEKLNG
ncbi:MAG TPA: FAD-dependent oxidoreductase [Thermoanaerobaculia bacterium]|nr:FAD-dependent oxidoreductase [Thermoanaerobaculia bacterium]